MNREHRIGVRLTEGELRRLERLEAATRRTRSDVLRLLLDAAAPPDAPAIVLDTERLEGVANG